MSRSRGFLCGIAVMLVALGGLVVVSAPAQAAPWSGTLTISVDRTTVESGGERAMVTARVSPYLSGGYYLSLYDESGKRLASCGDFRSVCSVSFLPPANSTGRVTAYVALDRPSSGAPTQDVRAVATSAEVTHLEWMGRIRSFEADPSDPAPGTANSRVTAQTDVRMFDGYILSIYDSNGQRLASRTSSAYNSANASLSLGADGFGWAYAYVAQDAPLTGTPSVDVRASTGPLVVSSMSDSQLADQLRWGLAPAAVSDRVSQLVAKNGGEMGACLQLGEKVRSHALKGSATDTNLVCQAHGLNRALAFLIATVGTAAMIDILMTTTTSPPVANPQPGCDTIDSVGNCIDDPFDGTGYVPVYDNDPNTPTPEPAPAGAGIPPNKNCLLLDSDGSWRLKDDGTTDTSLRGEVIESLVIRGLTQSHHVTTQYDGIAGNYTRARDFLDLAGYADLDIREGLWNRILIPHSGNHPQEYHDWVYDNIQGIDAVAQGDSVEFVRLFNERVINVIVADPTIVRADYWKCHRNR